MANPRSLVHALYLHWDIVEGLVRLSREFSMLTPDQVFACMASVSPKLDAEAQGAVLRTLVNADILQALPRSSDLQINPYVLDFVRGLSREHELGLAAVLQARVAAIRAATEALNQGMQTQDMDRVRGATSQLAERFRQISLQLDQDRHALLELAEKAKSASSSMPVAQRYRQVLEAYDEYVEPMNQMMDTGPQGTFYRYLEQAEQALDLASERLSVQGALYSHRLQLRQAALQAKELRRFGRLVAQQCADTLLPLREELRLHNALTSAISLLLGRVRKRGLRRTLATTHKAAMALPLWRHQRAFRLQVGDEVRAVMAAARDYQPQTVAFPQDEPGTAGPPLEHVDEADIRARLAHDLPIDNLLDWLQQHYGHFQDATLLRLFHDLQHEPGWQIEADIGTRSTTLKTVRIHHHPHRVSLPA